MALKHNKRRWHLTTYAKKLLFKADFAVFWPPKGVVEPTTWVHTLYTVLQVHHLDWFSYKWPPPWIVLLGAQNGQKGGIFQLFLTTFETRGIT